MVLEKTFESPSNSKEIIAVKHKGNQSCIFIGRTDAEADTPILWPPDAKNWLIRKDPDAGKDWRQEEKGMTEDEMVKWYHQLNECEFEIVKDRESWGAAVHRVAKSQTWLSNWTTTNLSVSSKRVHQWAPKEHLLLAVTVSRHFINKQCQVRKWLSSKYLESGEAWERFSNNFKTTQSTINTTRQPPGFSGWYRGWEHIRWNTLEKAFWRQWHWHWPQESDEMLTGEGGGGFRVDSVRKSPSSGKYAYAGARIKWWG